MNIGRLRKSVKGVRPSKISQVLTGDNSSESDTEEYITTPDNKTVDEALTLIDEYDDKFSTSQGSCKPEGFFLDSGEDGGRNNYASSAQLIKQYEATPYVPNKPAVPEKTEHPKLRNTMNEDGWKGKRKKKKKKRRITICTTNCKYEVVRRIALRMGMRDVGEDDSWNLFWTDLSVSVERVKDMKRFQKINHFPGMLEICRKDLLARNLNRMLKLFPKEYNIFPKTWCLPADYGELMTYARSKKNRTYICKPETGCQGKGIFVTKNVKDIKPHDRMVCQIYISRPFLVDGFKFDMRIYTLITSCDPLRIYVYNDGLARFATSRYREPTSINISNVFMHLTNYAVNKHSRTYVVDDEAGSKRKISTLMNWFVKKEYDVQDLLASIDDVIIKTVIAAHPILKHSYHACFPSHDNIYACFELLGFDILLDYKLKPYILEVNHSPSFHTDAQIDRDIKESLLQDTFIILNLTQTDKKKILEEDRRRVRERLLQGINHRDSEIGSCGPNLKDSRKAQVTWEESHMGNFRCIYPQENCEKYEAFFHQNQSSLFQDTAASRAREECSRLQREELEGKLKAEGARRAVCRNKEREALQPESPSGRDKLAVPPVKKKLHIPVKKPETEKKPCCLNSFEPDPIIEAEERERITGMAQREFLLKSFGITEQIIHAMKKNGTLRIDDEKKLNISGKLQTISHPEAGDSAGNKLPSMFPNSSKPQFPVKVNRNNFFLNPNPPSVNCEHNTPAVVAHSIDRLQTFSCSVPLQPLAGLSVTCNNAPIVSRPHIVRSIWLDDKERDIRFTKTHVARSITNTFKLQEIEKREQQRHFQNE